MKPSQPAPLDHMDLSLSSNCRYNSYCVVCQFPPGLVTASVPTFMIRQIPLASALCLTVAVTVVMFSASTPLAVQICDLRVQPPMPWSLG
jgi:hypothetical protein